MWGKIVKGFLGFSLALSFVGMPAESKLLMSNSDNVVVHKFEIINGNLKKVRTYKRKWGEVVLADNSMNVIYYIAGRFAIEFDDDLIITDLMILDDDLLMVNVRGISHPILMQIHIPKRRICVYDPSTGDYDSACMY